MERLINKEARERDLILNCLTAVVLSLIFAVPVFSNEAAQKPKKVDPNESTEIGIQLFGIF